MREKIFISYSHADYIIANAISKFLMHRGYNAWIDTDKIKIKHVWTDDVDNAIKEADYVFGILSSDSVKRPEVLRELSMAIETKPDKFLPIVIGRIHDSWFVNSKSNHVKNVKEVLRKYQHVEFNGRGDITENNMRTILDFLALGRSSLKSNEFNNQDDYIAVNGMPELMIDSKNGKQFYRVYSDDLSLVTGYPFALDNQWIPELIYRNKRYWLSFEKDGFASTEIKGIISNEQNKCLISALINMRQIVINNSAILNTTAIQNSYVNPENKKYFIKLLKNGSIVVFLYGANEMTPFVYTNPKYETTRKSIDAWNEICAEVPVYCIMENWSNALDQHSIDFVKFCCTIADNIEDNVIISECFGFDMVKQQQFFSVLKDIAVQGFIKTRMTGTNIYTSIKGLSRSYFYQNFIVREKDGDNDQPTLNCLFDKDKPFHVELKRMVDTFYNSIFVNYFKCYAMLPVNMPPELTFLSSYYLDHPQQSLSVEELEYAITEFVVYQDVLSKIKDLGQEVFLDNWTLEMVCLLREQESWIDYVSALESTIKRSATWQVDFSGLNHLVGKFIQAIKSVSTNISIKKHECCFEACYSFMISVGSSVCSVVVGESLRRFKKQTGIYKSNQNPVQIKFQLGDATNNSTEDMIFYPILLFDGMTDFKDGDTYFERFVQYLREKEFKEMI